MLRLFLLFLLPLLPPRKATPQHFFARRQLLSSQVSTSCMLERALEGCSVGAERLGLTCPNVTRCPGLERQKRTLMEGVDCAPEA